MESATLRAVDGEGQPDQDRDDLREMIASRGWRLFCDHVAAEWTGDRVVSRLRSTKRQPLLASLDAVHAVMSWPNSRIHGLPASVTPRPAPRPHRRAKC